jgi:hypothetical protein
MKYLKLYENYYSKTELNNFCEENLALLLDKGFNSYIKTTNLVIKNGRKDKIMDRKEFKWDDVKSDIIPFLELLREYYIISDKINLNTTKYKKKTDRNYQIIFIFSSNEFIFSDYYTYDDVINDIMNNSHNKHSGDNIVDLDKLKSIIIGIKDKK